MNCRNCDGQGRVIWRDGVALPAYPWNAKADMEQCKCCNGTGTQIDKPSTPEKQCKLESST